MLVIVLSLFARGGSARQSSFARVELTSGDVRCLDGNAAGFFFTNSTSSQNRDFLVYLQGGGGCGSQADCAARSATIYGTFAGRTGPEEVALTRPGMPFEGFATVYVPYCSGDGWRGTVRNNTWGLPVMGHLIVKGIIERLIADFGLGSSGNRLVLYGSSAGALGMVSNAGWVHELLNPLGVEVKAVADSGWSPSWRNEVAPPPELNLTAALNDFRTMMHAAEYYVTPACMEAQLALLPPAEQNKTWHTSDAVLLIYDTCNKANVLLPHMNVSLFMRHNRWDNYHAFGGFAVGNETRLTEWGTRMELDMAAAIALKGSTFGFFVPSCLSHYAAFGKFIGQTRGEAAIAAWYAGNASTPAAEAAAYQLMDGYGRAPDLKCNPSCGGECACRLGPNNTEAGADRCLWGCGNASEGVIMGFAANGTVDPTKDVSETNMFFADPTCVPAKPEPVVPCGPEMGNAMLAACQQAILSMANANRSATPPTAIDVCAAAYSNNNASCLIKWNEPQGPSSCTSDELFGHRPGNTSAVMASFMVALNQCSGLLTPSGASDASNKGGGAAPASTKGASPFLVQAESSAAKPAVLQLAAALLALASAAAAL